MTTEDRRGPKRKRVLLGAKIASRGLATSIDCRVRDLSDSGACLLVASPLGIPETFDLVLNVGSIKQCKVEWSKRDKIGVSFG